MRCSRWHARESRAAVRNVEFLKGEIEHIPLSDNSIFYWFGSYCWRATRPTCRDRSCPGRGTVRHRGSRNRRAGQDVRLGGDAARPGRSSRPRARCTRGQTTWPRPPCMTRWRTRSPPWPPTPWAATARDSAVLLPDGRVMMFGSDPATRQLRAADLGVLAAVHVQGRTSGHHGLCAAGDWGYGSTKQITVDRAVVKHRQARRCHPQLGPESAIGRPTDDRPGPDVRRQHAEQPEHVPPGWYMLSVTDANGIPSIAQWVRVA